MSDLLTIPDDTRTLLTTALRKAGSREEEVILGLDRIASPQGMDWLEAAQLPGAEGLAALTQIPEPTRSQWVSQLARDEEEEARWKRLLPHLEDPNQKIASSLTRIFPHSAESGHLSRLGKEHPQQDDALSALREEVNQLRTLLPSDPEKYQPLLAIALTDWAMALHSQGHHEKAVTLAQEAVNISRTMVDHSPDILLPYLAISLNTLILPLFYIKHYEEAFAAAREAITIQKTLSIHNPSTYSPLIADIYEISSGQLLILDRNEEAILYATEAVEYIRLQIARDPDTFQPKLASNLSLLSVSLSCLGRLEEALIHSEEAIRTLLPHWQSNPAKHFEKMDFLSERYFRLCKKVGKSPDLELVKQLGKVADGD